MHISKNVDLKANNTFGLSVIGKFFISIRSEKELIELIESDLFRNNKHLILGGGSNVLFTKDFDGLIIENKIEGKSIIKEDNEHVWLKIGGGENWHNLVLHTVSEKWGGIENLSLIPGTVGAAPMQNIGAYGVEIKDVFHSLEAIQLSDGSKKVFNHDSCEFGYRQSVFKGREKGKYMISSVTLRLSKKAVINTSYGAIAETLKEMGIDHPNIAAVSNAVIKIRSSKLPDPKEIGNAGSFFKNPTITKNQFESLQKIFPEIVGYENEIGIKVPAGWLIENAGWKGRTFGQIGVHKKQALVLVNYGGGSGAALFDLSEQILKSVNEKYGISLEREVNII